MKKTAKEKALVGSMVTVMVIGLALFGCSRAGGNGEPHHDDTHAADHHEQGDPMVHSAPDDLDDHHHAAP